MGHSLHTGGDCDHHRQPLSADGAVTYRLTVSYDGTGFCGWQVQPGLRTVQGCLQEALTLLNKAPVAVHGSGRTDTGVHAHGQVCHFRALTTIPEARMAAALNARLPRDIAVLDAVRVADHFHARFDVCEKTYRYRILNTPVRSPMLEHYAWHVPEPLDLPAMRDALPHLRGTHDFAAFAASGSPRSTTVRTLSGATLSQEGSEILLDFTADGFLYHMVRNLAGSLVEIGQGRRAPDWIATVLAGRNRQLAGRTAPPQGLYLMRVRYPETVTG